MWGGYCYSFTELLQGWKNHGRQIARATVFCTVEQNICSFAVWNLLLATRNLRWLQDLGKICSPLAYKNVASHSEYLTSKDGTNSR